MLFAEGDTREHAAGLKFQVCRFSGLGYCAPVLGVSHALKQQPNRKLAPRAVLSMFTANTANTVQFRSNRFRSRAPAAVPDLCLAPAQAREIGRMTLRQMRIGRWHTTIDPPPLHCFSFYSHPLRPVSLSVSLFPSQNHPPLPLLSPSLTNPPPHPTHPPFSQRILHPQLKRSERRALGRTGCWPER